MTLKKLSTICNGGGNSIPLGVKFKNWISSFPGIILDGQTVRLSKSSTTSDNRLFEIIKSHGGKVSLKTLSSSYCNGGTQNIPRGVKFKSWISSIPEIMIEGETISLKVPSPSGNEGMTIAQQREAANSFKTASTTKPTLITSDKQLLEISTRDVFFTSSFCPDESQLKYAAINCETLEKNILLIEIWTNSRCYIIDCTEVDPKTAVDAMKDMLSNAYIVKFVFDYHSFAQLLCFHDGFPLIRSMFDIQLAIELKTGNLNSKVSQALRFFDMPTSTSWSLRSSAFSRRPMTNEIIEKAAHRCYIIWAIGMKIANESDSYCFSNDELRIVQRASDLRSGQSKRESSFDLSNSFQAGSLELLEARQANFLVAKPIEVFTEWDDILRILPPNISTRVQEIGTDDISEIILDFGEKPCCWKSGERVFLDDANLVEQSHIDAVIDNIGSFGTDNRAGLERQLHRISCMPNRSNVIYALTIRLGRYVNGNADMIKDLLLATDRSILFLGEPGCGKTTIVREVTRILSMNDNVCVVDTSNEIAGDGNIRHHCIGYARRMMVNTLNDQANVMIQCVQNHTPSVMVIDEIGCPLEVEAARTCKQRGVRMIASAHGDLRKLIKNPKLVGLVGGIETITLGDEAAKEEAKKKNQSSMSKLKRQRSGEPAFDIIIELSRERRDEWIVVFNSGSAVDAVLEGGQYQVQRRLRDPVTGKFGITEDEN